MVGTRVGGMILVAFVASVAASGCGDDSTSGPEIVLEEVTPRTGDDEETTTTREASGDPAAGLQACLEGADLELAEEGATDLPITASVGGGPAIVEGAEGIGVRGEAGAAVAFVYDSPAEAESAASALGVVANENVVLVTDDEFSVGAQDAVIDCLSGGEATSDDEEGGGQATGVNAESAACVVARGFEIAEEGATDMPITDADGEGLPVIEGVAGIGIRGTTGAAVFFPFGTDAEATAAFQESTSNPDIELVAPRVDAIAIDNVFVMSDAGFPSDERFFLADCFD